MRLGAARAATLTGTGKSTPECLPYRNPRKWGKCGHEWKESCVTGTVIASTNVPLLMYALNRSFFIPI